MSGAGERVAADPMTADQVVAVTAALCRRFEGFRAKPYLCPAGVPTIGYGATAYLDGRPVRLADPPLSREAAERLLLGHILRVYLPGTQALCPGLQGRALAAITDFAFNLGLTRLKGSTLRRRLLAGDMAGAAAELRKWVRGGGRVLPGLVLRREAEAALVYPAKLAAPRMYSPDWRGRYAHPPRPPLLSPHH